MKRRILLLLFAVVALAGMTAQINDESAHGNMERGILMYHDSNYAGCIDRLSHVDRASLTSRQVEDVDYFTAMAAVAAGQGEARLLLERFLAAYPASVRRMDVKMVMGDVAFAAGDYAGALTEYLNVDFNCLSPVRVEDYRFRTSYCYLLLADYDEAETGFRALPQSSRYRNEAQFYEGYIAYCRQDYVRAKSLFEKVDRTSSPGNKTDYYLGQIYFMEADYDAALAVSRRVIKSDAEAHFRAEANRIAGESLFNMKREDEAIPYLERYVQETAAPAASSLYILGVRKYCDGDYAEAVRLLEKAALTDNAMGQSAWLIIGQSQMKSGNTTAAIKAFEKSYRMDFDRDVSETALYNYAVARSEGGRIPFDSSVSAFETVLSRYPDSRYVPQVQEYIIAGYMTGNNYESALRSIENIENPSEQVLSAKQRVLFTLGTRDYAAGQTELALERFRQAKTLSGCDAGIARDCDLWIGDCYYRQGKYGKASSSYLAFINNRPATGGNRTLAYYNLGYSRFGEKRYDDALTNFRRVIDVSADGDNRMLADACNRAGDCYYYSSRFSDALSCYDKAYRLNPQSGDYALYQKAVMMGLSKNHKGKINTLDEVIARFPTSGLLSSALLAKAESYVALGNTGDAIATYNELVEKYPSTSQGRNGYLQLAITCMNAGKRAEAVKAYKEVIKSYPTSEEARVASDDLKRIYADEGRLPEYVSFINTVPDAPRLEASEMDVLSFRAAEKSYIESENISMLKKYVTDYPDGAHEAQALYYLALASRKSGNDKDALVYASRLVAEYPDAETAEEALAIKAGVEYGQGDVEAALETYRMLEQRASESGNINVARLGIMRVSRDLGNHDDVIGAADRLLASSTVGSSDIGEIRFTRAYSLNETGRVAEAEKEWMSLAEDTGDLYGAKSAYYLAQYYYDSGNMKKARETVDALIDSNTPHRYWLARGFILLSDIDRKEGNTFEADEYLKSLRSNYPGTESDIFRMIDQRLK